MQRSFRSLAAPRQRRCGCLSLQVRCDLQLNPLTRSGEIIFQLNVAALQLGDGGFRRLDRRGLNQSSSAGIIIIRCRCRVCFALRIGYCMQFDPLPRSGEAVLQLSAPSLQLSNRRLCCSDLT